MTMDAHTVIAPVLSAILTIVGFIPWHNAQIKKLQAGIPQAEPLIQRIISGVEALVKVPVIEQKVVEPVKEFLDKHKTQKEELIRWATIGLHAYRRGLDSLSDTEKAALAEFVRKNAGDATVTAQDVLSAVRDAQVFADRAAASTLFKNAVTFTETIRAFAVSTPEANVAGAPASAGDSGVAIQQETTQGAQTASQTVSAQLK